MEFSYHWRLSIPSASHTCSALRLPLGPQERSNTAFTSRKHVSFQLLRPETSEPALPHLIPWLSLWKILFALCPDCTCPTAVSCLSHPPLSSATTVASTLGFLPSLVLSCPLWHDPNRTSMILYRCSHIVPLLLFWTLQRFPVLLEYSPHPYTLP